MSSSVGRRVVSSVVGRPSSPTATTAACARDPGRGAASGPPTEDPSSDPPPPAPGHRNPAAGAPPAVAGDRPIDDLAEAEGVDDLVESGPGLRRLDAPQPGVDLEVAPTGQGPVDD